MKCDACSSIFCKDHIKYDEHQCTSSHRKNIQIPICPLCNQAVPYEYRDQSPDRVVSAHIDRDCRSDPARQKREKIYTNKCSISTCKQREAIQVNCEKCLKTFCLRHRFPDDHRCQGPAKENNRIQEQNDFLLAQALQESEREAAAARRRPVTVSRTIELSICKVFILDGSTTNNQFEKRLFDSIILLCACFIVSFSLCRLVI